MSLGLNMLKFFRRSGELRSVSYIKGLRGSADLSSAAHDWSALVKVIGGGAWFVPVARPG